MKKSIPLAILGSLTLLLQSCTVVETRTKSQSAGNREASAHYFMFRATKTDADRISILFNPPPLEDQFATHANDWQLHGLTSLVNIPISAVCDLLCLPVDAIIADRAMPDTPVSVYWQNKPITRIRVTRVKLSRTREPTLQVYENSHPELMAIVNELLAELPAAGSVFNKNIGFYPKARIDFYDADGKRYYLENFDDYIEAPMIEHGRFYGDTYARETQFRRLIDNIPFLRGTRELDP